MVTVKTTLGDIKIELFTDKAPISCENFLKYCNSGFYKDLIFHRIVKSFVIQAGAFFANLENKPGALPPIKNESDNGLHNLKYTIGMARSRHPDSATSQFYINLDNNNHLDFTGKHLAGWGYTVFGKVVDGFDVVDKIGQVKTINKNPFSDLPEEPVTILDVIVD